jgi:methyl-accepting chemotaxis protein
LNGDVRFWPSFLVIFRRQTHEFQLNQSENMQRLSDALEEPARTCVEMLFLTDAAKRVMSMIKQNFGNTTSIMNQLEKEINFFDFLVG